MFEKKLETKSLTEYGYKLTLAEQRLVNMTALKLHTCFIENNLALKDLENPITINISINEYKKEFNIPSNSIYQEMEGIIERLRFKEIFYKDFNNSILKENIFKKCFFSKETNTMTFEFNTKLQPYLIPFNIENYRYVKNSKKYGTWRLYYLLKNNIESKSVIFTIDELRFKFGLFNNEYPKYFSFKQKVINPAIKEINKNLDIEVELLEIKNSKSERFLEFRIKPKNDIGLIE